MADLYKGIEGSPITYLTADISANQTTISIADDSALPDAPNIATIGYGENLETIKYGVKSNGVLQNVIRGIEGTPRAWPAGTEVARFFTAYDHNSIIENFNSHLAENASKHITESGSNENGRYIKFDDGTQICYGHNRARDSGWDIGPGSSQSRTFPFPASFTVVYGQSFTGEATSSDGSRRIHTISTRNRDNIAWEVLIMNIESNRSIEEVRGQGMFAIGRWK